MNHTRHALARIFNCRAALLWALLIGLAVAADNVADFNPDSPEGVNMEVKP